MGFILHQRVGTLNDTVSQFIVTMTVIIGGFFLMLSRPDMAMAVLPIVTLTVGHFYGRNKKEPALGEKTP